MQVRCHGKNGAVQILLFFGCSRVPCRGVEEEGAPRALAALASAVESVKRHGLEPVACLPLDASEDPEAKAAWGRGIWGIWGPVPLHLFSLRFRPLLRRRTWRPCAAPFVSGSRQSLGFTFYLEQRSFLTFLRRGR